MTISDGLVHNSMLSHPNPARKPTPVLSILKFKCSEAVFRCNQGLCSNIIFMINKEDCTFGSCVRKCINKHQGNRFHGILPYHHERLHCYGNILIPFTVLQRNGFLITLRNINSYWKLEQVNYPNSALTAAINMPVLIRKSMGTIAFKINGKMIQPWIVQGTCAAPLIFCGMEWALTKPGCLTMLLWIDLGEVEPV